jgi:hypothetical protein
MQLRKLMYIPYKSDLQKEYAFKYGKDPDDCYALPEFEDWKQKAEKVVSSGPKTEEFFVN